MPAHNARNIADHIARGTHRFDRHASLINRPRAEAIGPAERRRLLRGLGPEGRRFVSNVLQQFGDLTPTDLLVLRRAAAVVDRIAALEQSIAGDGLVQEGRRGVHREHALAAKLRAESGLLGRLLKNLKLEK